MARGHESLISSLVRNSTGAIQVDAIVKECCKKLKTILFIISVKNGIIKVPKMLLKRAETIRTCVSNLRKRRADDISIDTIIVAISDREPRPGRTAGSGSFRS